ncbi:MAG: hypothetical protein R2684_06100 [Pyrinomonadaceae bacterium]
MASGSVLHKCAAAILTFLFLSLPTFGQRQITNDESNSRSDSFDLGAPATGCNDGWNTSFTSNGANARVDVVTTDAAGNFYIGGSFSTVNGVAVSRIAKFDGTNWSAIGTGFDGTIRAIAVSGSDVYVGGSFSTAGGTPALNVAKWNGTSWSALGTGLGNTGTHGVNALAIYDGTLYAGGNFSIVGGSPTNFLASWNGSAWVDVGSGVFGGIEALYVKDGLLYAGGNLSTAGGNPAFGAAVWNGATWNAVGNLSTNTIIKGFATLGTDLIAIGSRIVIPGQADSHVAKWNGTQWTRMAFFADGFVNAVAVLDGTLYVGGGLPTPPNLFNNIARWDGSNWSGVGGGISGGSIPVRGMAASNGVMLVGGSFDTVGGIGARNLAIYSNGNWGAFSGNGLDNLALAINASGENVYVGGSFIAAGPVTANRIAKWNGVSAEWSVLGIGISGIGTSNSSIRAIAAVGNKVYVGGSFGTIGGIAANNVAMWNGTNWTALGTGVNSTVSAIIVKGEDVYVGGAFTTAGGVAANRVAKWNGSSWSGLNSSIIPNNVTSMARMGDDIFVGSDTTTLDNPNYLVKYDGTGWTTFGTGITFGGITSIAVAGNDLYVSGGFTAIGGVSAARVAKWNGKSWSALGAGVPGNSNQVKLTRFGNGIILSGDFTNIGSLPANRIARWDGTEWFPLGTGLDVPASVLAAKGGDLFVGGGFSTAGCNVSPFFARYRPSEWTGALDSDWHNTGNWSDSTVPESGSDITIAASDVSIASADVTLSTLVVSNGRTVTIGGGRVLTVNESLDLSNGNLAGGGSLVVNGDLILNGGGIGGLTSIVVNGNLYLDEGIISSPVNVSACRASAISGGSAASFIDAPLTRCATGPGIHKFPVGSGGAYAPFEIGPVSGNGNVTVQAHSGAYSGAAAGLPVERLTRWWSTAGSNIGGPVTLQYNQTEIQGYEPRYKVFSILNGSATQQPTSLDSVSNRATGSWVEGADYTLAEGASTPQLLKGRVTTARGRGAESVVVKLVTESGAIRYTLTNPFGYYRFKDVMTWEPYVISIASKRYRFNTPSQSFIFPENSADFNFQSNNP